jgi:hypothetical protein
MTSESTQQAFVNIAESTRSAPALYEFELAYQSRIAIDRIRFAIRQLDHFCSPCHLVREVSLELLDALSRLEAADRRFQMRSRRGSIPEENGNGTTRE